MKIAIVTATYQRPDGQTPVSLDKTLALIDAQTFKDYQLYVVGDAYENEQELKDVLKKHNNIKFHNLKISPERDRYGFGNTKIWCAGGVTAVNKGIEMALADGADFICHLSHDDLWEPNHLETINKMIKKFDPIFMCTLSTYMGVTVFPAFQETHQMIPFYPIGGGIIASSACVKYSQTKIRPMDRLHKEGIESPCDAYLWDQLRDEMKEKNIRGYLTTTITCHHDDEGYAMGVSIPLQMAQTARERVEIKDLRPRVRGARIPSPEDLARRRRSKKGELMPDPENPLRLTRKRYR